MISERDRSHDCDEFLKLKGRQFRDREFRDCGQTLVGLVLALPVYDLARQGCKATTWNTPRDRNPLVHIWKDYLLRMNVTSTLMR